MVARHCTAPTAVLLYTLKIYIYIYGVCFYFSFVWCKGSVDRGLKKAERQGHCPSPSGCFCPEWLSFGFCWGCEVGNDFQREMKPPNTCCDRQPHFYTAVFPLKFEPVNYGSGLGVCISEPVCKVVKRKNISKKLSRVMVVRHCTVPAVVLL